MKKIRYYILLLIIPGTLFWIILPDPLFRDPTSTILLDRNNDLLGARIAGDGQWRFPAPDSIPVEEDG